MSGLLKTHNNNNNNNNNNNSYWELIPQRTPFIANIVAKEYLINSNNLIMFVHFGFRLATGDND